MKIPAQSPAKQGQLCLAGVELDQHQHDTVATYLSQHTDYAKGQGVLLLSTLLLLAIALLIDTVPWDSPSSLIDLLPTLKVVLTCSLYLTLAVDVGIIVWLQSRRRALNRSMLQNANLPYPVRMELHRHGKNVDAAILINLLKHPFRSRAG